MAKKTKKLSEALKQAEEPTPETQPVVDETAPAEPTAVERAQALVAELPAQLEQIAKDIEKAAAKPWNPVQDYVDGLLLAESDGKEDEYIAANASKAAEVLKGLGNWLEDVARREGELAREKQAFDEAATGAAAVQSLATAINAGPAAETLVTRKAGAILDQLTALQGKLNDFQDVLSAGMNSFMKEVQTQTDIQKQSATGGT